MKNVKKIKDIEHHEMLKEWSKGSTLTLLAKKYSMTRQAVKQKLDIEQKEVYLGQEFEKWFKDIIKDEKGNLYPFVSFKKEESAKFYAYMLKKYFNYHVIDGVYCSIENLNIQKVRTLTIEEVKKRGLPLLLDLTPKDNKFAFKSILFFTKEEKWDKFFILNSSNTEVIALKGKSLLLNVSIWLENNKSISIEEVFEIMPAEIKNKENIKSIKVFITKLKKKKNYLYELPSHSKKMFLSLIGVDMRISKEEG